MKSVNIAGLVAVMFADEDEDITLGTAASMQDFGQSLADELDRVITARDAISDAVLAVFTPSVAKAAE